MHVLRVVVHVVEVDDAVLVRLHDLGRKQKARGDVLRHLAGHIVALHGVDRRVLVRVLLLNVLVVALDERHDLLVGRVRLALEALPVAVRDVLLGDLARAHLHDLVLDDVLDLLDRHRAVARLAYAGDLCGNQLDAPLAKRVLVVNSLAGLANGILDLGYVKRNFLSAALDNLHRFLLVAHVLVSVLGV